MSRSDRLFDLAAALRDGRLHRAEDLARRLGVTVRTIYRDMETLAASGLPVAGERGAGYRLTASVTLPPLDLTHLELEALELGMAVVAEAADPELQAAARALSARIGAAVPQENVPDGQRRTLAVPGFADPSRGFRHLPALRAAIRSRQKLELTFRGGGGDASAATVRPLQLDYQARSWILAAWDETAAAFRTFRVDRIDRVRALPELFVEEPGKSLADYIDRLTQLR